MRAEIELECKQPSLVMKSLKPEAKDLNKFKVRMSQAKGKLTLEVEAEDIAGLLAGVNSYMRLIKVAIDATEI
jgi:tRNA threonylcarbamoyladenosine modification (KEOPS) complex  Pcc1 subunit